MGNLASLMTEDKRAKLAREMSHSGKFENDAAAAAIGLAPMSDEEYQ